MAGLGAAAPAGGERRRRLPLDELLRPRLLARGVAGRPHDRVHLRPRRPAPRLAEAGERARARRRSPPAPTTSPASRRTARRSSSPGPTGRRPRSTAPRCSAGRRGASSRARPRATGRPTGSAIAFLRLQSEGGPDGDRRRRSPPRTGPSRARWRRCRAGCARPRWSPDGRTIAVVPVPGALLAGAQQGVVLVGVEDGAVRTVPAPDPRRNISAAAWTARRGDRLPAGRVRGERGREHGHPRAAGRGDGPRRLADVEPVERPRPRRARRRPRRLRHALAPPEPPRGDARAPAPRTAAGSRAASRPTASPSTRPTASGWPSPRTAAAG